MVDVGAPSRRVGQGVALVLPGPEPELVAGDGVFRALRVLLRLGKALFAGGLLVGDLGFAGAGGGQVLFEDHFAGLHLFHGSLHGGDLRLGGGALRLQKRLLGVQGGQLLACRGSFAGEGVRLRLRLRESLFGLGKLLIICRDLLLLGRDLPGDAAAAGLLVLQLLLHAGDVGAVVLDAAGQIVGRGYNTREADGDPLAHAEIIAMRQAAQALGAWNLADCTLAVTLEPCPMCAGACIQTHIGTIAFGAWDPKLGACGSIWDIPRDPHIGHSPEVHGGVLEGECQSILTDFFAQRR